MGTNPQVQKALAPAALIGTSVECDSSCKIEWQRAQLWLAKHSTMKVQTATDVLIQTYNPGANVAAYGFSVTKEPIVGTDRYRIQVEAVCTSWLGCAPTPEDVRSAFLYYVKTGEDLLLGIGSVGVSLR